MMDVPLRRVFGLVPVAVPGAAGGELLLSELVLFLLTMAGAMV